MISNLKIKTKFLLAFFLIITVSAVSLLVNILLINYLSQKVSSINDVVFPTITAAYNLRESFNTDIRAVEEYGNGYESFNEAKEIVEASEKEIENNIAKIERSGLISSKDMSALKAVLKTDEVQDEKVFETKKNEKINLDQQLISPEVHKALVEFDNVNDQVQSIVGKIIDHLNQHKTDSVKSYESFLSQSRLFIALSFMVSIIVSLLIVLIMAFKLSSSIKKVKEAALKMSQGDLSLRIPVISKDEIGELSGAFNQMADNISKSQENLKNTDEKLRLEKTTLDEKVLKLNDSEKAMLNILDDAQRLEEQLKVEKGGVEKKIEERTGQLQQEKTKLSASVSSLPIGFIMIDESHNVLFINKKALEILRLPEESVKTFDDILNIFPKDSPIFKMHEDYHKEKILIGKKGEVMFGSKTLMISLLPIKKGDEVLGNITLIDDITEAKVLDRSKDEFFSIASHELRTPLTAIRGNTSLIEQYYSDQIKDKDLKEMIDDIHESSIRLIEIVNDFLDMSRLELGKIVFKKEVVDITEIIQSVIKEYQTTGSIKMLYLKFNPPQNPVPKVLADADRLRQILINLIGNAIKFTEKGGIVLDLVSDDKFIKVYVKDTGNGISEKSQNLLFRKFQQAAENIFTRDTSRGTGLGLYISKLMVEGMGGQIFLEKSEVGKGTTFSFTLPVAKVIDQKTIASGKDDFLEPMTKTKIRIAQGK